MKKEIIAHLLSLLDGKYILVRKERVITIAHMANELPNSKIVVLSLLRLDGSDLKSALSVYNEWNKP